MTSRSDWYPHYHGARTLLGPRKGPAGPLPPTFQRGPITASLSWRVLRRASHATTGKKCIWKTKTSRKRWLTPLHACIGLRERWPDPVPRTSLLSLSLSFSAPSFLLFSLRTLLVSLLYAPTRAYVRKLLPGHPMCTLVPSSSSSSSIFLSFKSSSSSSCSCFLRFTFYRYIHAFPIVFSF